MRIYENQNDPLVAADENSLYPAAMIKIEQFPDISKSVQFGDTMTIEELTKEEHGFIVECDILIPKDLKFIPVCVKDNVNQANTGCFY